MRRWKQLVVVAALALPLLGGTAYLLKGGGYWYAIKQTLGLAPPLREPVVQMTGNLPTDWGTPTYDPVDPDLRFAKTPQPIADGIGWTSVQMGPDGLLWGGTEDGRIARFPVDAHGDLGEPTWFDSLQQAHGGPRLLIGLAFEPGRPADDPVIWVTHNYFAFKDSPDFSGMVSRLRGPDLAEVTDVVVGLPRSTGDHATLQATFGPEGDLYIPQASNTAFGDPDETWGMRPERLLSATILQLHRDRLPDALPIDVTTVGGGGSYDPAAEGAPLTIYATGVRLAYDLIWHDNGHLYVPVNGSSPGGNVPAAPDGSAPAIAAVPFSEHDWFLDAKPGRYYGHPNPSQGHYILNGANPTAGEDFAEVPQYPVGPLPDPRYAPPIRDLGDHRSANGIIQFRNVNNTPAERKLDGTLVICRYSLGNDLTVIRVGDDGQFVEEIEGIPGFTQFRNPLDVTQDPTTGHLYVSDYGERTILRVSVADGSSLPATAVAASPDQAEPVGE